MEEGKLTFAIHRVPVHNLGIRAHEVHLPEGVLQVHLTELRGGTGRRWGWASASFFLGRVVPVGSGRAALRWVRGDVLTFISRLTYVGNPLPRYAPFWLIASFFKGWFISPGCPTKMAIQRARSVLPRALPRAGSKRVALPPRAAHSGSARRHTAWTKARLDLVRRVRAWR